MAGIYIHIPFCKQLCFYCDFYKSNSLKEKPQFIKALKHEIELQKNYLEGEKIETIYFGGGTPSVLKGKEINSLFKKLSEIYEITDNPEITLEVNPDDIDKDYVCEIKTTPVNRLSIGIQSFFDEDLLLLNRRHNKRQAINAVKLSQSAGFSNISIDLIYGIPGMSVENWKKNLKQAFEFNVQHISAYFLTIEPGTVMAQLIEKGDVTPLEEEENVEQYSVLLEQMAQNNFIPYEISNFCKEGYFSKHNTNYWKQEKYLGLGPSAHSYNGHSRQWNIADNDKYIQSLKADSLVFEREILDPKRRYNDYILTSLRTMWGVDLKYLEEEFSKESRDYCVSLAKRLLEYGMINIKNESLILTKQGKFIADNIISELLMTD
ncbi:MAG: radical SAM family heme chaperone HemW [Bacteroidales bacterium]|nr:radical SAM family heme chaperone HemW [Bacteroidales bacterium]